MGTQFATIAEYNAWKEQALINTDSRVREAYKLELEIKRLEDELQNKKGQRNTLLSSVGKYDNGLFSVNMKLKARKIEIPWVRENMPELMDYAEPSDKFLLQTLFQSLGRDKVKRMVREADPQGYDDALSLSVKVFDEKTGDSSRKRKFAGKAYLDEWVPAGEYCIEYNPIAPQLPAHNPYPTHDNDLEDDENDN